MTEAEGFLGEVGEDIAGVAETGLHAVEGIYDGATGDWDGAADSAQSMSESAIGVATGGISELAEMGWDAIKPDDMPSAHEAIHDGLQSAGEFLGDGLHSLVGDEAALQSARDFDDGNYLAGVGDMAGGIAHTVENAAGDAVNWAENEVGGAVDSIEQGISDLF
jgi:hypothetical protein